MSNLLGQRLWLHHCYMHAEIRFILLSVCDAGLQLLSPCAAGLVGYESAWLVDTLLVSSCRTFAPPNARAGSCLYGQYGIFKPRISCNNLNGLASLAMDTTSLGAATYAQNTLQLRDMASSCCVKSGLGLTMSLTLWGSPLQQSPLQ
eukprot:4789643-Amphidinium_carterae.1